MFTALRFLVCLVLGLVVGSGLYAQGGGVERPRDLPAAIGQLGSFDYQTRMNAARFVRRAPESDAGPALAGAVRGSDDQFVRYRAFVLLTAFSERRTAELVRAVAADRNDRLREVAYRWLASRPAEGTTGDLLAALATEQAEFVRPVLVRALAARGADPDVRRALVAEVSRGQDFFRLGVIDALGEFRADYAVEAIAAVARIEGPLQDDAVLALGRIGDRRAEPVVAGLRPSPEVEPAVQAARCLLGGDCDAGISSIVAALDASASRPEVARAALTALTVLGVAGSDRALSTLEELSRTSRVQQQAGVAFGGVALRDPARMLEWLARQPTDRHEAMIETLRVAFERFEEDFSEEQFFASARAAYWRAAEGSAARALMARLIERLEF